MENILKFFITEIICVKTVRKDSMRTTSTKSNANSAAGQYQDHTEESGCLKCCLGRSAQLMGAQAVSHAGISKYKEC